MSSLVCDGSAARSYGSGPFLFKPAAMRDGLAGWPVHGTSAEEVEMQVSDSLAAIRAGVDHQPITVTKLFFSSYFRGSGEKPTKHRGVFREGFFG